MVIPSLKHFLVQAPSCNQSASLTSVLQLSWEDSHERLVVLDADQQPVGVIRLANLLSYVLQISQSQSTAIALSSSPLSDCLSALVTAKDAPNLNQALITQCSMLIEAVVSVSNQASFPQLWSKLASSSQPHWVLVNAQNQYLGLLDSSKILQFLAANPKAATELFQAVAGLDKAQTQAETEAEAELSDRIASISWPSLIKLLDQIPLPIALQNRRGQLLHQNQAWQTQFGGLDYLNCLFQAAPDLLKINAPVSYAEKAAVEPSHLNSAWNTSVGMAEWLPDCSQIATDTDTCTYICKIRDGQNQIWRHVKLPLGISASLVQSSPFSNPHSPIQDGCFSQFPDASSNLLLTRHLPFLEEWLQTVGLASADTVWLVMAQNLNGSSQATQELADQPIDPNQANPPKNEFLAYLSHELKTPLNALLGLSGLLKDHRLGPLNQRQTHYTQLIHQNVRYLMTTVNDVLDLTRLEAGQLDLNPVPINLEQVCRQALDQAEAQNLKRGGETEVEVSSPLAQPPKLQIAPGLETVHADQLRLRQMLSHLLSNALKYTPADGSVGLRVEKWSQWVGFTIWDTGVGIAEDQQHLLFQKFQRLENPLSRHSSGAGLGLVLTRKLSRLHGGDVTFISKPGEGSQFTLLLPLYPNPIASGEAADIEMTPLLRRANRLIVLIDTIPRRIQALTHQLNSLNYQVAIARSNLEAIDKVSRLQPCATLLNPIPFLEAGCDLVTILKSSSETAAIPVIATAFPHEVQQDYPIRADYFLPLPIHAKSLQHVLASLKQEVSFQNPPSSLKGLTVLHLRPGDSFSSPIRSVNRSESELNRLLQSYQCRVLEVDDLDQADLLARVWRPHVALIDPGIEDPLSYLQQLSCQANLAALPLVTLTGEATQAANSLPSLAVFPCLAPLTAMLNGGPEGASSSALLQVIQIAARESEAEDQELR